MCAIIGWKGNMEPLALRQLIHNAVPWGPHSIGIAWVEPRFVPGGSVFQTRIYKRAIHPYQFLRNQNRLIHDICETATTGFVHVRDASIGSICDANAHPFVDAGTTFCHNGTLQNHREIHEPVAVDSQVLGRFINRRDLSSVRGTVALSWIDQNQDLWGYHCNKYLHCYTFPETGHRFGLGHVTRLGPLTILVSRTMMLNDFARKARRDDCKEHVLREGTAYRIHENGAEPMWESKVQIPVTQLRMIEAAKTNEAIDL